MVRQSQTRSLLFGHAGPGAPSPGERPYLRFAHVSDTHFTLDRRVGGREARSPELLEQLIDHLNQLDLDMVVLTGDLIHLPRLIGEDAPALAGRLSRLKAPWHPAVGNHDVAGRDAGAARATWRRAFAGHIGDGGRTWYAVQPREDVQMLVLDTTDHEEGPYTWTRGYLGREQLAWVESQLAAHPQAMTMLAMHHPLERPLPIELLSMTAEHRKRLTAILNRSPQVKLILSGHYHVARLQTVAGAYQAACPGFIEYPHAFRVFSLYRAAGGYRCELEWHRLADVDPAATAGRGLIRGLVRPLVVAGRRGTRHARFHIQVSS